MARRDDTLKNFEDQRLHWPFCQWLIQLSKYRGFCMLALLFLVVVNLTDFHQVGAASSAPSWMKDGAYMKYEWERFFSCVKQCSPVGNTTWHEYVYVEFASVHESIAEIAWRFSDNPHPENAPIAEIGYLDVVTGNMTIGDSVGSGSPLIMRRYPLPNFWINPRGWQVNPATIVPWDTIAKSGFPVDDGIYSEVDCWEFQTSDHDETYRIWFDKITGIMVEYRYDDPFHGTAGGFHRAMLYETNIPVGRQGVGPAVVETLTANSMTYAAVLIAAVGAVTVVFVAFVMLRKRTPIVCGQCGRKMRRGSAFCDKCGTALASSDRPVLATPTSDTR